MSNDDKSDKRNIPHGVPSYASGEEGRSGFFSNGVSRAFASGFIDPEQLEILEDHQRRISNVQKERMRRISQGDFVGAAEVGHVGRKRIEPENTIESRLERLERAVANAFRGGAEDDKTVEQILDALAELKETRSNDE